MTIAYSGTAANAFGKKRHQFVGAVAEATADQMEPVFADKAANSGQTHPETSAMTKPEAV